MGKVILDILGKRTLPRRMVDYLDADVDKIRNWVDSITFDEYVSAIDELNKAAGISFFKIIVGQIKRKVIPKWKDILNVPFTTRVPMYRNMTRVLLIDWTPEKISYETGEPISFIKSLEGTPFEYEPEAIPFADWEV